MTKRKLLSTHFSLLMALDKLSKESMKALYLYTQEGLSEKEVSERLQEPVYQVRKHLNYASFIAKQAIGDKEYIKALEVLKKN